MGPDIDSICKSGNLEKLKMVGRRVVDGLKKHEKTCVGLVWEWFGGAWEPIGSKHAHR